MSAHLKTSTQQPNPEEYVPAKPPQIARLRLVFGYLCIFGAFFVNRGDLRWWALSLVALGGFVRVWSAGSLVKTKELSTEGPYAISRNPLYVGTFIAGLGLTLFVHSAALFVFFFVTFFVSYRAQILWEEKVLRREHSETFPGYCQKVARFFPARWSGNALKGSFSFGRLVKNKELAYQIFWIVMVCCLMAQAFLQSQHVGIDLRDLLP